MAVDLMNKLGLEITQSNFPVRAEQMRTLIRSYPAMIIANVVMVPLVIGLMWAKVDHTTLLGWGALLYAFHAFELFYLLRSQRQVETIEHCQHWQRQFLVSDIFLGMVWGSAGILMFVPGEPVFQAFILCIMMGLAAGSVAGNLAFPFTQQIYALLVVTPIFVNLLTQGESEYFLFAGMAGVFLFFVLQLGREQSRLFEQSIRRGLEHNTLVNDLRLANDRLSLAQREAQAGIWDWDISTGKLAWSDELFILFGLKPGEFEPAFETWHKLIHPADRTLSRERVAEALRLGLPLHDEYRILLPQGGEKWIASSGNAVRNSKSETVRMIGLCFDITAQKEDQLRAQRAALRYQTLIEQVGSALIVHDMEGRVLEVNRETSQMLGYDREELLRMEVADFSPAFDRASGKLHWNSPEPITFTSVYRRKDGSSFPVEVRMSGIELDGQKMVMVLASDINERLSYETALQKSEERYRNFAEKLPLGITVLQDGLVRYVNEAMTKLLDYPAEELLEQPFMHLIHEEDRAWAVDLHRRRMQGEDVRMVFPVRMIRRDGTIRRWELNTSTTEWDGTRSSLAIVADITERVAMEEALRNSVRQLEAKELAKTRFLAAAGHDLRQPVAAANLFVDALKATDPTPRQTELIGKLDQSMAVFSDLLERLLNISKFDAGQIKPQLVSFDLAELLGWLDQNFAESARKRGLSFRIFFSLRQAAIVRTDIGLLHSVMMNLVTNAIKYTSWGGVLVAVRRRQDKVLLQVWDTGCGISDSDMDKIFDEFYQVDNPQRNREAGLGLGLSICQRAMALLGGEIVCRSTVGRGSVFELTLPLVQDAENVGHFSAQPGSSGATDQNPFEGKRIVVLEDDKLVADGMTEMLRGQGALVTHFQNGEEALSRDDIVDTDLFVVDFSLGQTLTGAAFLRVLQSKTGKPIRGVIVTGETSSRFIEGIAGLSWPVLHKPVNYAKLVEALDL